MLRTTTLSDIFFKSFVFILISRSAPYVHFLLKLYLPITFLTTGIVTGNGLVLDMRHVFAAIKIVSEKLCTSLRILNKDQPQCRVIVGDTIYAHTMLYRTEQFRRLNTIHY